MVKIEILVINGSPGSGKTSTANAISELLRKNDTPHVVIDFDELGRIYPETDKNVQWQNLKAICDNFSKVEGLQKFIIPIAIDSMEILNTLKNCAPYAKWMIVELVADREILLNRVTKREPNEYWRQTLRALVNNYADRSENTKFGDFKINTSTMTSEEVAKEILLKIDW